MARRAASTVEEAVCAREPVTADGTDRVCVRRCVVSRGRAPCGRWTGCSLVSVGRVERGENQR